MKGMSGYRQDEYMKGMSGYRWYEYMKGMSGWNEFMVGLVYGMSLWVG